MVREGVAAGKTIGRSKRNDDEHTGITHSTHEQSSIVMFEEAGI